MRPERRLSKESDERRDHSPRLRPSSNDSLEQDPGDHFWQLGRLRRRSVGDGSFDGRVRGGRREEVKEEVGEEPGVGVGVSKLVGDRGDEVVLSWIRIEGKR